MVFADWVAEGGVTMTRFVPFGVEGVVFVDSAVIEDFLGRPTGRLTVKHTLYHNTLMTRQVLDVKVMIF